MPTVCAVYKYMCSEAFNLIDTFLQMCFQGIKIILACCDSIFILCCAEVSFVDDAGDATGSVWESVRWQAPARMRLLWGRGAGLVDSG